MRRVPINGYGYGRLVHFKPKRAHRDYVSVCAGSSVAGHVWNAFKDQLSNVDPFERILTSIVSAEFFRRIHVKSECVWFTLFV